MKFAAILGTLLFAGSAFASVTTYGDKDLLGFNYPGGADPTAGATLEGLAAGVVTYSSNIYSHGFPFAPVTGDYAGTDTIYVGSVQTSNHDGYSGYAGRVHGPQVFSLDYASLIPAGSQIDSLTLGIGADDFQAPTWGQNFSATVNGTSVSGLDTALNSLNLTGPKERFFSLGIDPAILATSRILTLSINEGGDGGDGWAVDFLTVGATTHAVPEPGTISLLAAGSGAFLLRRRRRAFH